MASTKTCIQIDNNIRSVGGRTMFYDASKVEDGRVRVIMYGRVVFMTETEYALWKSAMSIKNK